MTQTASPAPDAPELGGSPTAARVVELQAERTYPAVSLLVTTTPGARMTAEEHDRLRALSRSAGQRLREEDHPDGEQVLAELERLVSQAAELPSDRATALFASAGTTAVLTLPVEVEDRCVVDPSFATRDLVRALHRTPRHVVLVLSGREARLFDGGGGTLRSVKSRGWPRTAQSRDDRRKDPGRDSLADADLAAFLREVDAAVGSHLKLHPAPLVAVGPDKVLAAFRSVSKNTARLAGTLSGNHSKAPLPELAERIAPVLSEYLQSRETEAMAVLEQRTGEQRSVSGMPDCWLAARTERPEMLAVEEGFFYPARLEADGDLLEPATDVEHPDVLDDAVDELIELVLDRGGWIALVGDDVLADRGHVALTLRRH